MFLEVFHLLNGTKCMLEFANQTNNYSLGVITLMGSSIGWGLCLMKRRLLVQIFPSLGANYLYIYIRKGIHWESYIVDVILWILVVDKMLQLTDCPRHVQILQKLSGLLAIVIPSNQAFVKCFYFFFHCCGVLWIPHPCLSFFIFSFAYQKGNLCVCVSRFLLFFE